MTPEKSKRAPRVGHGLDPGAQFNEKTPERETKSEILGGPGEEGGPRAVPGHPEMNRSRPPVKPTPTPTHTQQQLNNTTTQQHNNTTTQQTLGQCVGPRRKMCLHLNNVLAQVGFFSETKKTWPESNMAKPWPKRNWHEWNLTKVVLDPRRIKPKIKSVSASILDQSHALGRSHSLHRSGWLVWSLCKASLRPSLSPNFQVF